MRRKPAVGGGTIASALSEARASLKDPSRPFTPHALRRDRSLGAAAPVRGLPADPPADAAAPPAAPPAAFPDEDPRQAAEDRALRAAARCLANVVELDSSAACDVLQRALAPWFGTGTFNSRDSVGRRAVLAALAAALAHDDAGTRLAVSRETAKLLDGSRDLPGDAETTLVACRAAFDVSRSPAHDALFFDEKVVPGLVRYAARGAAELQGGSEEHVEALVYCAGALKNLTNDEASLRRLAAAGVAGVACDLARACAARATTRHVARLAAQAAGALRNLSGDRGALKPLEAGGASRALAALLVPFEGDADVVLHAARALAKLSLHEGTRRALHGHQDGLDALADALRASFDARRDDPRRSQAAVRLAFGLGNLAAGRDETRAALADRAPEIARLAGRAARDFVDDANDEAAEQLSIRLVRLAANAAITPEVGVAVATHQAVAILPEALDAALRRDCEELALNVVSCVTNLSYYALEGRARGLFADLDAICVSLLAVTVHANHEAVSEAARAFGNFSRDEDARRAMRRLGVVEALVLLLGHPARDVVFAAAGALVNAAVDGRDVLWEHKAHEELVAVVRRAGVQDLDLAAVACKALHNLLLDAATAGAAAELLGGATHGRLLDTLGELVAVADDDDFLAAAGALRTILEE